MLFLATDKDFKFSDKASKFSITLILLLPKSRSNKLINLSTPSIYLNLNKNNILF